MASEVAIAGASQGNKSHRKKVLRNARFRRRVVYLSSASRSIPPMLVIDKGHTAYVAYKFRLRDAASDTIADT